MYNFAYQFTFDEDDAKDLVQDTSPKPIVYHQLFE
jgi:DNA-directed RNA polymerase specialized sigma24 family protein